MSDDNKNDNVDESYLEDDVSQLENKNEEANVENVDEKLGEEEENIEEVEEEEIPEVYYSEDFISTAFLSEKCTLPDNILEFHHSFGYNSQRPFNLVLVDPHTLIFSSGNLINFFDTDTRAIWFRRSAGGGGIGHIVKNPVLPHFAVGEMGNNPLIVIYEWPSIDVISVLRDGTTNAYAHLDYSPDGKLLCSQGAEPDFMLTIWNWSKSRIMLRRKSYNQVVTNVMFSPHNAGLLTSSGIGHIKFWKMALTFTGLKLIGELGRFGKTEMSDIVGLLPMADEKVLSGCTWGNMLLWDEGLIKLEAYKRGRQKCHEGVVVQMHIDGKNLLSIGTDGLVILWDYRIIENADPPAEDLSVELIPRLQFDVGNSPGKTRLISMIKCKPEDSDDFNWFAQDGKGGIWKAIMDTIGHKTTDEQIFFCHGGNISEICTSPRGNYCASIGQGGRVQFYNYLTKKIIVRKQLSSPGSSLLWLPLNADNSGNVLVSGFNDGVVRVFVASLQEKESFGTSESEFVTLIQVIKPHTKRVGSLSVNSRGSLLVSGSDDGKVFVFAVQHNEYVNLVPVGFVEMPSAVTTVAWKPEASTTLLVGCMYGEVLEMILPTRVASQTVISYKLDDVPTRAIKFQSVKAQIRRDIKLREIAALKSKKVERKKAELKKIKEENPGLDFDEDTFLEDSDEEEELEPLHIPEVPNRVLFAMYTPNGTVWLSMAGYDAGYIYEYDLDHSKPLSCTLIPDADDIEIHCFVYNHNSKYLIFGMHDGRIRVNRVNPVEFRDLQDYWLYSMHDNRNGIINRICFSCDYRYVFSCGADSNLFVYKFHPEDDESILALIPAGPSLGVPKVVVSDITNPRVLSLEEMKFKIDYDRRMAIADQRKKIVLKTLASLAEEFAKVLKRNQALPPSQMIPYEDFLIDERINEDLIHQFQDDMDLTKRMNIFKLAKSELGAQKMKDYFIKPLHAMTMVVTGLCSDASVTSVRQRKLPPELDEHLTEVKLRLEELERRARMQHRELVEIVPMEKVRPVRHIESFLRGINRNSEMMKKNMKLRKLIERYILRQVKIDIRATQWFQLRQRKPDPTVYHPKDVIAYDIAQQTIGDYKLKTADNYRVPKHLRMTTDKKYEHLLEIRKLTLYDIKEGYIQNVMQLRETKIRLMEEVEAGKQKLVRLQSEIDASREALARHEQAAKELEKSKRLDPENPREVLSAKKLVPTEPLKTLKTVATIVMLSLAPIRMSREYPERYFELPWEHSSPSQPSRTDPRLQEDYEVLLLARQIFPIRRYATEPPISEKKYLRTDARETRWEVTLKTKRMEKVLFDQLMTVEDTKQNLKNFDQQIRDLDHSQLEMLIRAKFLEIYILTMNQELIILKTFESREEILSNLVVERMNNDLDMRETVNGLTYDIEMTNRDIYKLGEKEKEITASFMELTAYNRFRKQLRRIYKKRYRPPGQDDSSSSSSSSDEGDTKSVDSLDIAGMHTDETHCPEGCDRELFQLTFTMRTNRHQVEMKVSELRKTLETSKRALGVAKGQQKILEAALKESQETLEAFQREKQQKLNQVYVTVIVQPKQMRHFIERHGYAHLTDTLVFSKAALRNLLVRSSELDKETEEHNQKFKAIRKRFKQIKIDCRLIEGDNRDLMQEIVDCKIRKFGSVVDVDFLEQTLLRQMITALRTNFDDYKKEQDKTTNELSKRLQARNDRLCCVIKENTEKLNVLLVLEREKNFLVNILRKQEKTIQKPTSSTNPYTEDNKRLAEMARYQALEIEGLKQEIEMLKSKTAAKPVLPNIAVPICVVAPELDDARRVTSAQTHTTEVSREADETKDVIAPESSTSVYVRRVLDEVLSNIPNLETREEAGVIIQSIVDNLPPGTSAESMESIKTAMEKIVYGIIDSIGEPAEGRSSRSELPEEFVRDFLNEILERSIMPRVSIKERDSVMDTLESAASQLTSDNKESLIEEAVASLSAWDIQGEMVFEEDDEDVFFKDIIEELMNRIFPRLGHSFRKSRSSVESDIIQLQIREEAKEDQEGENLNVTDIIDDLLNRVFPRHSN